jgi:hypothetical protein
VSWSCAGFLLSASVDKTVKLWHLSQPGPLRSFGHPDFVTSVQFHPQDAQRFVSGEQRECSGFGAREGRSGRAGGSIQALLLPPILQPYRRRLSLTPLPLHRSATPHDHPITAHHSTPQHTTPHHITAASSLAFTAPPSSPQAASTASCACGA